MPFRSNSHTFRLSMAVFWPSLHSPFPEMASLGVLSAVFLVIRRDSVCGETEHYVQKRHKHVRTLQQALIINPSGDTQLNSSCVIFRYIWASDFEGPGSNAAATGCHSPLQRYFRLDQMMFSCEKQNTPSLPPRMVLSILTPESATRVGPS